MNSFVNGFRTGAWSSTSPITTKLCDRIQTEVVSVVDANIWSPILSLYIQCAFSNLHEQARRLLETYFSAAGPTFDPDYVTSEKQILGSIWEHAPAAKPSNVPWTDVAGFDPAQSPQYDITKPEFFRLMNWAAIPPGMVVDEQKMRAWRTLEDHLEIANCARFLCNVPEGQVATQEAIRDAFDALERVLVIPMPRPGEHVPYAFSHVFPPLIYFCLAAGLGEAERARQMFIASRNDSDPSILLTPALYSLFLEDSHYNRLIEESTATPALLDRMQHGRREHLHGVEWPELLRRFSEAAFRCYRKQYRRRSNRPLTPSDILNPPITPEKLAEVEGRLGPLPPDLREMVQVANGFRGCWHTFGGGFPAIDLFYEEPAGAYFMTLTENVDEVSSDAPLEGAESAPIWIANQYEEADDFVHIVCPASSWLKMVGDDHPTAGECRVVYTSHWMDNCGHTYRSIRHWIATETVEMERHLERLDRGETTQEGEGFDDDDGEEDEDEEE